MRAHTCTCMGGLQRGSCLAHCGCLGGVARPWFPEGLPSPSAVLSLEEGKCGSDCSVLGSPRACVRVCMCRGGLASAQGRCSQERQLASQKQPWFPFSFLWLSEGPEWVMSLP